MENVFSKIPNWLRYLLAIPFGILCLYIVYYVGYFSNRFIASPDSLLIAFYNFLYVNGINVLVMISSMNYMLPKHQFKFTLTISIIFCSLGLIGLGMNIILQSITFWDSLGFLLTFVSFVGVCCYTFSEYSVKSDNKQVPQSVSLPNDYDKYIELSNIIIKQLNATDIDDALIKSYEFYQVQGIDVSSINLEENNKHKTLANLVMLALGVDNIDEAIAKTNEFYQEYMKSEEN